MGARARKNVGPGRPRRVRAADEIRAELQQLERINTRELPPEKRGPIYDRRVRLRGQLREANRLQLARQLVGW
jgi:hypothetical protein